MSDTLKNFRPLLSATLKTADDFGKLEFPVVASAKIDGIRVICHPTLGPVTRTLKPVPNDHIREFLSDPHLKFLDGEVVTTSATADGVFNSTQSAVMSKAGKPTFTYHVFDHIGMATLSCPFQMRFQDAMNAVEYWQTKTGSSTVRVLPHTTLLNLEELAQFELSALNLGYEGVMVRSPGGRYKFGRSTLREGILCKIKRFMDDEAVIVGWEPLLRNMNEATVDARGYTKRSKHSANLVEDLGYAGKVIVLGMAGQWEGIEFSIGAGLDDAMRMDIATNFETKYRHQTVAYKYLPYGSKDAPRHPIWKGLRYD